MPDGPDAEHDVDPADIGPIVPPAYSEPELSCVRIAYLQAVMNNVFGNMSVKQTNENLNITLDALDAAGVLPDHPRPVRTLASAKRRLGIDPDQWIVQYAICSHCWKHFTPFEMTTKENANCTTPGCLGQIYEEYTDVKGRLKRRALKILPQVSLIQSIRRLVRRKGFRKLIRDSRNTPIGNNDDDNYLMTDMHDGEIWHDLKTGIKREVGNLGTVRDIATGEDTERRISEHRFGLHMSINIDW
jgi:hypothetical protein